MKPYIEGALARRPVVMAILEILFLLVIVPPWVKNLGKRLVRSPKVYLSDTGLASYLQGVDGHSLKDSREKLGALLENFVLVELFKQQGFSKIQPRIYHYRTHSGEEVDFVLESLNGDIVGVEVKSVSRVDISDFKGLYSLAEAAGKQFKRGILFYTGNQVLSFGQNIWALPIQLLWEI